jgi:hypothetical protein
MLHKVIQALSKLVGASSVVTTPPAEADCPPNGDAIFRGGVLFALGPTAGGQLLRELDYGDCIRHLETMRDLRGRELAALADLDSLR